MNNEQGVKMGLFGYGDGARMELLWDQDANDREAEKDVGW